MELIRDTAGFCGRDLAVGSTRSVIQFAVGGVTGSSVVPRVRGLLADAVELLEKSDIPIRLKFLQDGSKRGGHDATTDENHIESLGGVGRR